MRSLRIGMNTRQHSDKAEIDKQYQLALETNKKTKHTQPPHTSTPIPSSSVVKELDYSADGSLLEKTLVPNLTQEADSNGTGDETIKPSGNEKYPSFITPKREGGNMAHHNPFATLKYAVEAVPFFDGKNIPLNYFIEGCEEAKGMLPAEAESQFTKIIRTRIVGEARRTIRDIDFENVNQLTKYLKRIYGGSKNLYQLQGELGNVYQKNEEDVVTYANRVKLLGKQIREAYRTSGHALGEEAITASLEKDMCKCFIRGLKPDIEQRVNRNLDVQGTIADALRIERELSAIKVLRKGPNYIETDKSNRSNETCQICFKVGHIAVNCRKLTQQASSPRQNNLGTDILICQICKKRGHSADKCRSRDPQTRQAIYAIQGSIKCQLCLKSGHNAKNCYQNNQSKQINNANNNTRVSIICQWCDKQGHSANNCWKKQNEQANSNNQNNIMCQICNNSGHTAKGCRSNGNSQPNSNVQFCRYCKEQGHLLEDCQLRIASNNRRRENSSGNANGPSKAGVPQGSNQTSRPSTTQKTA